LIIHDRSIMPCLQGPAVARQMLMEPRVRDM
jgi:hypothetical protein